MELKLIKLIIAGVLFSGLVIAKKKKTKNFLLWALTGYLVYLGINIR